MHRSHIGFQKWAIAIYLWSVSLKGVSSMRLHRDLKITQKSAYFMAQRLREAWTEGHGGMAGPVEIDETHIDGKEIATREVCLDGKRNDQMAFHALAEYQNHVIGWLQWEQSSPGDGAVVRFPQIWMSSGECRCISLLSVRFGTNIMKEFNYGER